MKKQILIKSDGTGYKIEAKGLTDIEILGLLTAFKSRVEYQLLQSFVTPPKG